MPRSDSKAAVLVAINALAVIVLAILPFALSGNTQDKPLQSDAKPAAKTEASSSSSSGPEKEHFYYHSWKKSEIKMCESYSGALNIIICDSDDDMTWNNSFLNMVSENRRKGMNDVDSYKNALRFALEHGKVYPATFSDIPWPAPQTGFRMSLWSCTKDKKDNIDCGLGSRSTKDATGE